MRRLLSTGLLHEYLAQEARLTRIWQGPFGQTWLTQDLFNYDTYTDIYIYIDIDVVIVDLNMIHSVML